MSPIKDVLLPIIGYPEPTPECAVERAVGLAASLGAALTALRIDVEIAMPVNTLAGTVLDIPGMVAEARNRAAALAEARLEALKHAAGGSAGPELVTLACREADVADAVIAQSRIHDLTLLPVARTTGYLNHLAERVVFAAGRPVLVLPEGDRAVQSLRSASAVVAWDHSRPAARAVADALPLLQQASAVHVVSVVDSEGATGPAADGLLRHLERHGITATAETVARQGRPVGDVLAETAQTRGAGLLVMGAFGHSRLRDFILGGATRTLLENTPLPVLLSH